MSLFTKDKNIAFNHKNLKGVHFNSCCFYNDFTIE